MTFKNILFTSITGLRANKTRSALTVLGIVIGITAIITMMSIGRAAENLILSEISGFGAEVIVIRPGQEPTGPTDIGQTLFADSLSERDVTALKKKSNVPGLVEIAPAVIVPGSVSYKGETMRPTIFGWSSEFVSLMFNIYPEQGSNFDESDIKELRSVAIIGSRVNEELFGGGGGLGEQITIKNRKFRVVGIYPPRGQTTLFNIDELVIIPYTTAQTYILGINHYHEILTRAESSDVVDRTVRDIEVTLRDVHKISDPSKDDFFVVSQKGAVDQIRTIIGALTAFLSSVVAIGLVVGGVGVMNIMFVSVTERTREIGLRKALGATDKDILMQFLFEAVILTGIGGALGVLFGGILAYSISFLVRVYFSINMEFIFPLSAVILGIGVSAFVGLIFGIYPAMKASKKSPIEALRYE